MFRVRIPRSIDSKDSGSTEIAVDVKRGTILLRALYFFFLTKIHYYFSVKRNITVIENVIQVI